MSNRRSIADFPRNEAGLVGEFIGTAYDTVKSVADNLPEIQRLDAVLEEIPVLAQTTVDAALAEAIPPIMTDIQVLVDEAAASAQQAEAAVVGTIRVPASEGSIDPLPLAAQRAGMTLGFDASGNQVMQDFRSAFGARNTGYLAPHVGAFLRSIEDVLGEAVSVGDFGAIGDGTYHPIYEWFTIGFTHYQGFESLAQVRAKYPHVLNADQSIDWAAFQQAADTGKRVRAPVGYYVLTDSVVWPVAANFEGEGYSSWTPGSALLTKIVGGTNIMMYGTGPKIYECDHVGMDGGSRGSMPNPDAASAYTAYGSMPTYSMVDLTNGDAVGANRATLRKFSAAFVLPPGGNTVMRNFRIVPYYNGMAGYTDMGLTGMGDNWDVGILNLSGSYNLIENVQVVGYWRTAAIAKLATPVNSEVVQGESDRIVNCILQGFRSLLIRTPDSYHVVSSNDAARTLRILWSASHRWPSSGTFRLAGTDRTYTSLTLVETGGVKYLEFGGVSGTLGSYTDIFTIRTTTSHFGTSGTTVTDCTMGGLTHHSRLMAFSNLLPERFTKPDAAIEISGNPLRAIQFANCTVVGSAEILLYLNYCTDIQFRDTYFEGQASFTALNSFDNQTGRSGRIIATPGTTKLDFGGCTNQDTSVDKRPRIVYPLSESRFTSGTGLFNPRSYRDDSESMGFVESNGVQIFRNLTGSINIESGGPIRLKHGLNSALLIGDPTDAWSKIQATNANLRVTAPIRLQFGNTADVVWYQMDSGRFYSPSGAELGGSGNPFSAAYVTLININGRTITCGSGSPEGVVTASPGSFHLDTSGKQWSKATGIGNTGWVVK